MVQQARGVAESEAGPVPSGLETVQIARQAIYDASLHSRAYELFYRGPSSGNADADPDRAACSLVLSAFVELGLARVAGNKCLFLNVAHDVMSGALPLPVPPELVVLQVRDYEHSVRELARGLEQRRREGFKVALEGFVLDQRTEPLIELADYLKLDVRRLGAGGVARQLERIGRHARATVACHVETSAEFSACAAAGCSHFQGRFLFRPQLLSHKRLPKSLKIVTRLLKRLRDPAIELAEIDRIVRTDAALAAGVLKLAGSAAYATPQPVTSVVQAVGLVGLREFSKWITVVALTSTSERPSEVSLVALSRARACELVAARVKADAEAAFLVGLMSALEALFQQPLATLLEELPISAEVRAAVLQQEGPLGKILLDVLSREDEAAPVSTRHQTGVVNGAWLEALSWASETLSSLR